MKQSSQSLTRSFYRRNFLSILLAVFLLGSFWFISSYQQLVSTTELLKEKAIQQQRQELKQRTLYILNIIKHEQQALQKNINEEVRQSTNDAYAIVKELYNYHKENGSMEQIRTEIKNVLKGLRHDEARGYYFTLSLDDSIEKIALSVRHLEGTSFFKNSDIGTQSILQDLMNIARNKGEGAYNYTCKIPNDPQGQHKKIAYVKYFAPLNWVIGIDEYVDKIVSDHQKNLIERIEKIKFDNNGYVFVTDFSGLSLSFPAKGRNMYEVRDNNGLKIVQEMIAIAKEGQGFLEYVMPPLEGERPEAKISYVAGIPEWGWYVGSGDFIADLDAEVSAMLKERKISLIQEMITILCTLIVSLLLLAYSSHRFNKQIISSFSNFRDFFHHAADNAISLDLNEQKFIEFQQLALDANKMVDKRREAENFLRSEEFKFRTLFEHVSDYVLILQYQKEQLIIVNVSESACRKHDYTREELIGKPLTFLTLSEEGGLDNDKQLRLLQEGKTVRIEVSHRRKDGSIFPVETTLKMVEIEGESYLFAIERDVTEQKKLKQQQLEMEEQLRQRYKMEAVGLMAGGMAHNFNNSLAIVLGNLEMAQRKLSQPEKLQIYLTNALNAIMNTRSLINQIMTYSHKGNHEKKSVQLSIVIEDTLKLLHSTAPTTLNLSYSVTDKDKELKVYADSEQLQETLLNLYTNALHATDEEGEIRMTLQSVKLDQTEIPAHHDKGPGIYAKLSIKDNGCGIAPATLDKIFDPFFTTKDVGKGTGMGLSSVQGIMEQHAGFINVISSEGQGTTFELYFPTITNQTNNPLDLKNETILKGSENVLLVDDEKQLIHIDGEILTDLGYKVTSVSSGKQALELIQKNPESFDLILTDQTMPEMTGKELAVEIRKAGLKLPIILCTGYSSKITKDEITSFGITAYCTKPLRLSEFSHIVRETLDHSSKIK
ncbi:PAS domain S-box-containing protein [Desulfuromusa kysingii]|uniref:histidine kinase n=1 Tax=Desulfuromusa kysingii TaxID=37625 RepID=A0A1H3Y8T8_9BACT|nr:cache domain-containing protein [Desulfuromusa kysingii]SEA07983.1 PAS domain S-box-containing protein [Desulfuromusa kysingii]